ncbi:hypothetical protein VTL71DRAFT_12260 [Oculimacula yallundae]|uniref:Uncharacterized protein n=1 Tax=Oculimacula yallundae TaxID=86028 RepID=A0ABR4BPN0_9HELO
MANWVPRL